MRTFLDKIFLRSNNLHNISNNIKELTDRTPIKKIFEVINNYSSESEVRFVGGCIRKIINKEKIDDIDLATNLKPIEVCDVLKKNNINYYESGIAHGTITATENEYRFEITTLRKDIVSDGRHAEVEFSNDWKEDASRRDFTINSIYSDSDGNLFDPYDGKNDLKNGYVKFIGDADLRIKEDYLRILRYIRFFSIYSKQQHNPELLRIIKKNIKGVSKLSKDRLLDELRKMMKIDILENLSKDKKSIDLLLIIFPELKNVKIFSKLKPRLKDILRDNDAIFLISLMIIDETDNADYFLYKFNFSKKDEKRIKNIDKFFKEKINSKTFLEENMNKIFYYYGKETALDILNYRMIKLNKYDNSLKKLIKNYENKLTPKMPVSAELLMKKYEIPEGKQLGEKLRIIETEWVKNNFRISEQQVDKIVNN